MCLYSKFLVILSPSRLALLDVQVRCPGHSVVLGSERMENMRVTVIYVFPVD
jgi:hypothetical protein